MEDNRTLSTGDVARVLGLSVTTIKRYVDDGTLRACLTAGRHRKIPLREVKRFVRANSWPAVDWRHLAGPERPPAAPDPDQVRAGLLDALTADDTGAARRLLHHAYDGGMAVEALADAVLSPVMAALGHGRDDDHTPVLREHRATQTCLAALHELKARLAPPDGGRPVAVGGCPEGDHYLLATLLAEMALRDGGWHAVNVGPNTPAASFAAALDAYRPRLLWLSFNHLPDPERFLAGYRDLDARARARGVAVVVGGRALTGPVLARMPGVTHGAGMAQLVAFARGLDRPRPRCARGRPPRC